VPQRVLERHEAALRVAEEEERKAGMALAHEGDHAPHVLEELVEVAHVHLRAGAAAVRPGVERVGRPRSVGEVAADVAVASRVLGQPVDDDQGNAVRRAGGPFAGGSGPRRTVQNQSEITH